MVLRSYINRRLTKNFNINSIISSKVEIPDHKSIANTFNQYFASISSPKQDSNFHNLSTNPNIPILDSFPITDKEVTDILKQLPYKPSPDLDGLSYRVLKEGGHFLATCLRQLFSLSLEVGRIPQAWKVAIVTPIYKDGDRKTVSQYRPISVTSSCCRVFSNV